MQEKNLKTKVLKELKNKKSKTEIYNELRVDEDDNLLRRILASRPSASLAKKYRFLHKLILGLWILFLLVELSALTDLIAYFDIKIIFSVAITIYLFIQIWKFNGDVFLPSIFWLTWGVFNNIKELVSLPKSDPDYEIVVAISWTYTSIIVLTIILTYIVYKNVFGYYYWFKPSTNGWNQHVFQDED